MSVERSLIKRWSTSLADNITQHASRQMEKCTPGAMARVVHLVMVAGTKLIFPKRLRDSRILSRLNAEMNTPYVWTKMANCTHGVPTDTANWE